MANPLINSRDAVLVVYAIGIKNKTSFMNLTSIAFLLRAEGKCILLMGDADPMVVANSLAVLIQKDATLSKSLHIDLMKVSHHGSKANMRKELLEMIDCQTYLFTTNGGSGGSYHPDRMTLAYLWKYSNCPADKKLKLYFNYTVSSIGKRNVGVLSTEEQKMFDIVDTYEDDSQPKIAL